MVVFGHQISLKSAGGQIYNKPTMVQMLALRQRVGMPISEANMT